VRPFINDFIKPPQQRILSFKLKLKELYYNLEMSKKQAAILRGRLIQIPENGDQTPNFIIVQEFLQATLKGSGHDFSYCTSETQPGWYG
jgi:hypothetical protein